MSFFFHKIQPNGTVSEFHTVAEAKIVGTTLVAIVSSYATLEALNSPANMLNWQDRYEVPLEAASNIEAFLIGPTGQFLGGTLLEAPDALTMAKNIQWAKVKFSQQLAEYFGFSYQGNFYDSNLKSQQRIQAFASVAQAKMASQESYVVNWTLKDNSVVQLDAPTLVGLAEALVNHTNQIHQLGQQLRDQIYSEETDTVEKVEQIRWSGIV